MGAIKARPKKQHLSYPASLRLRQNILEPRDTEWVKAREMAILCASSSFSATTSPKPHCACARKSGITSSSSPFVVGFSQSLSSSNSKPGVRSVSSGNRRFEVRCEKKEKDKEKYISRVPLDQRWLFEDCEVNGPVISTLCIYKFLGFI